MLTLQGSRLVHSMSSFFFLWLSRRVNGIVWDSRTAAQGKSGSGLLAIAAWKRSEFIKSVLGKIRRPFTSYPNHHYK